MNRIKWIIGTLIGICSVLILMTILFKDNEIIQYNSTDQTVPETVISDTSDIIISSEEEMNNIQTMIKEYLSIYHTYAQIDNSYMCKMAMDYMTSECMFDYLMAGMGGKAPWDNADELIEYIVSYEPNRANKQHITDPEVTCHVSDLETLYEVVDERNGILWCHYEICHDYITIKQDEYYDQMAKFHVCKENDHWKVNFIDFISLGGIKGFYDGQ